MNRAGTDTSNRGQMSATHDSREVLLGHKGAIHVVKDETQILPYCILHLVPMRTDLASIREKLCTGIDGEYNVTNMAVVLKVIAQLESFEISVEELEATGLDVHMNELRRKAEEKALAATSHTDDVALATRAKNLIKKWDSVKE